MPISTFAPLPGETYDATQKPPSFGHALKQYFAFDKDYVNLNHGAWALRLDDFEGRLNC